MLYNTQVQICEQTPSYIFPDQLTVVHLVVWISCIFYFRMQRFIAVTTKAPTLIFSELLQSIPKSHNPLTCDNLNSSYNLCFGIPVSYFCLQPKCLYLFVSPCTTHNICMCSFWVLYQINIQYFLLRCMGVRGEQSLWMFRYKQGAEQNICT